MTGRRNAAQILAMVAWAERQLKQVKARALEQIDVQHPEESLHAAVLVDGTPVVVAKSTRVQNAPRLKVIEDVRFAEWVQQRWPEHIVPAVAEAFLPILIARMAETGGVLVDRDGEVCQWAELTQSDPYTRTSLTKDADDALAPLLARRTLAGLADAIENTDAPVDLDEVKQ